MPKPTYNVLFLCTGNSARSILAEAILNRKGSGRFRAYSAGSHPTGTVHPLALDLLRERGFDTSELRSKSWDEFATPDAPPMDFLFAVCDNATGETCPIWPGHPATAHWEIEDPAACTGPVEEQRVSFRQAFIQLDRRINLLVGLRLESIDRMSLKTRLDEIGKIADAKETE